MIDSKTRAILRGIASTLKNEIIVGQNGITENVLAQIEMDLDARELVKIRLLPNADGDVKSLTGEIANVLGAEPVTAIGRKIILYRYSKKAKKHVLDFSKDNIEAKKQQKTKQNKTKRK